MDIYVCIYRPGLAAGLVDLGSIRERDHGTKGKLGLELCIVVR